MALRLLFSLSLGLLACALLLTAMALLVSPASAPPQEKPKVAVMAVTVAAASQPPPLAPPLPPPPEAVPPPPSAMPMSPAAAQPLPELTLAMPAPDLASSGLALVPLTLAHTAVNGEGSTATAAAPAMAAVVANGGSELAAVPVLRIDPRYPPKALREGKEGWVKLRFTIAVDGSTKDIEVVDARPRRLFEAEARRALARWKYQPRIVAGRAVEQPGELVQLDFVLEKP